MQVVDVQIHLGRLEVSDQPVSYVNAPQLAADAGIDVRPVQSLTSRDYVNLVTIRSGDHAIAGTLVGLRGIAKVVMVDGFAVDVPPADNMLVVRNDDIPGMIGAIGSIVGASQVNIDDMVVGQDPERGASLMVLATTPAVPDEVIKRLGETPGIVSVIRLRG